MYRANPPTSVFVFFLIHKGLFALWNTRGISTVCEERGAPGAVAEAAVGRAATSTQTAMTGASGCVPVRLHFQNRAG